MYLFLTGGGFTNAVSGMSTGASDKSTNASSTSTSARGTRIIAGGTSIPSFNFADWNRMVNEIRGEVRFFADITSL